MAHNRIGPDSQGRSREAQPNAAPIINEDFVFPAEAWRCWTWQLCPCDCPTPDDCIVITGQLDPEPQPCRGMLNGSGRWVPCCTTGAAQ